MPSEVTLIYRPTEAMTFPLRWFATWLEQQAGQLSELAEIKFISVCDERLMNMIDGVLEEPQIRVVCRVPESADHKNNRARQQYGELPA